MLQADSGVRKTYLSRIWLQWRGDYLNGIKSVETEDWIDLLFYRPSGLLFAKVARLLRLSPNAVTIFGMLAGVLAGLFLATAEQSWHFLFGALALLASGVLDSADGQLARMTGTSSQLGLVLDGICDNVVFGAIYLGGAYSLLNPFGIWAFALAVIAGACHSLQSATLDFYLREYLFFTSGKPGYWNPTRAELRHEISSAKGWDRVLLLLRFSWISQQQMICGPRREWRLEWRAWAEQHAAELAALYRRHHYSPLYLFRPLGSNLHTLFLLLFFFLARFDLYLLFVDLLGMNLLLCLARKNQIHADAKFHAEASQRWLKS